MKYLKSIIYICIFLTVIVLGIGSRAFADQLPLFVSRNFGDALWGSMVYFGFRVLFTTQKKQYSLVLSLIFSFGIEFSQLYQEEWMNSLRSTLVGGLILGKGFLWIDLLRYTVGIGLSYVLDIGFWRWKVNRQIGKSNS